MLQATVISDTFLCSMIYYNSTPNIVPESQRISVTLGGDDEDPGVFIQSKISPHLRVSAVTHHTVHSPQTHCSRLSWNEKSINH